MTRAFLTLKVGAVVLCLASGAFAHGGGSGGLGFPSTGMRDVPVRGYFRSNGTYVQPYMRSAPGTLYPYVPLNRYYPIVPPIRSYSPNLNAPQAYAPLHHRMHRMMHPYAPQAYAPQAYSTPVKSDPSPILPDLTPGLRAWIGRTYNDLSSKYGEPDVIHQRLNTWSVEYKDNHFRYEYFLDNGPANYLAHDTKESLANDLNCKITDVKWLSP